MFYKRAALRTGFGAMIALLIVSTIMAWRIQDTLSRRTVEIHHSYVQRQRNVSALRRIVWLSGSSVRDFFLNDAHDRVERFATEIQTLHKDADELLTQLAKLNTQPALVTDLRAQFTEIWKMLELSQKTGPEDSKELLFVRGEVVPRREAASAILRRMEQANDASLVEAERDFAAQRNASAGWLVIMLALGVLMGLAVARYSLRHSETLEQEAAQRFKEVLQAKEELERLSARLMAIQEEERTRLSRELHDEIVQTLAVLKIEIAQAQTLLAGLSPEAEENLERAHELAKQTVRAVRNISLLLRPSLLDDLGLGPALQWQAEDFRRRTRISCSFVEEGLRDDLPEAVKTCVYRVTQEALHNCEKHAAATHVSVKVVQAAEFLSVEVRDDGIGFEVPQRKQSMATLHFGILGMRERAAGLNGTLNMDTHPGKGTTIFLWLPLMSSQREMPPQAAEIEA
ncbi:MAG TPA: sensor histidine kinase [Bryobacteraceae bacterium]|nr:sensor histidine kinase [Bryobacteraceae bacterium]